MDPGNLTISPRSQTSQLMGRLDTSCFVNTNFNLCKLYTEFLLVPIYPLQQLPVLLVFQTVVAVRTNK